MHLFDHTFDHDYYFGLPREEGAGAHSIARCSIAHHSDVRAVRVRTELFQLLVIHPLRIIQYI